MLNIDPKTNKITIINGDTGYILFSLDNYQLTGGDIVHFTVKKNFYDAESEIVISQEYKEFNEDGTCLIRLKSDETQGLTAGTYHYDIQVNLNDGRVDTIIGPAKMIVNKGVTDK